VPSGRDPGSNAGNQRKDPKISFVNPSVVAIQRDIGFITVTRHCHREHTPIHRPLGSAISGSFRTVRRILTPADIT